MKRNYSVLCNTLTDGIRIASVNVVAENEDEAKNYALQTLKNANGIKNAQIAFELPGTKVVLDNGPASRTDINSFNSFCKKYNIK